MNYIKNPNDAVNGLTDGDTLVYTSPMGTWFQMDDGSYWYKESTPNTWVQAVSSSGGDFVDLTTDQEIDGVKSFLEFPEIKTSTGNENIWSLPSKDELNLLYTELHSHGVGDFKEDQYYWSSSASSSATGYCQTFLNGEVGSLSKITLLYVRAIRQFISSTIYNLRDIGPNGGLIFYKSGHIYLECASADESTKLAWSDVSEAVTTETAVGTGWSNTDAMLVQSATAPSAKACRDKPVTIGKYDILINKQYVDFKSNLRPLEDSTDSIQITKADGVTPILTIDSLNENIKIGKGDIFAKLDVAGGIKPGYDSDTLSSDKIGTIRNNIVTENKDFDIIETSGVYYSDFFENVVWSNCSISCDGALIYNNSLNSKNAIAVIDFGETCETEYGDFMIEFPNPDKENGFIRII